MPAVLFHSDGSDSGVPHYRDRIPAAALRQMGYTCWLKPVLAQEAVTLRLRGGDAASPDAMMLMTRRGSAPVINPTPVASFIVDHQGRDLLADNVIADNVTMYRCARERGQHIFCDLDDDIWQLPPWNPAAEKYDRAALEAVEDNLNAADGVLCSTPPLAEQVAKHCPDAKVFICPNAIDAVPYTFHPEHAPLRVGWCGMTDWRVGDLAMAAEWLREALGGLDVEFWQLGAEKGHLSVRAVLKDWPVPITEHPWVPMSKLNESLAEIDIAVCPMEDIPINRSRSATTGLALAAAGIPFVASPTPAYVELAEQGAGLLAETGDEWVRSLRMLIANPSTRETFARQGRRAVLRSYAPKVLCKAWDKAFRSVR